MAYTYEDKLEFAASLYCSARLCADQTGCSWELIIAQAIQETGWGQKCLPGTNNLYNIKADKNWTGPKKNFHVKEVLNGKTTWVDDDFRVYDSYGKSLEDRMLFLEKNKRYRDLQLPGIKGDYVKEAHQLVKSGYATDPDYAESLIAIIRGPSFRRAIARAKKRGCANVLPSLDVLVVDGAKVPIPEARIEIGIAGKKAEATTDDKGRLVIRTRPNNGDLHLKVFDKTKGKWIDLEPLPSPTSTSGTSLTVIAPSFTAQTSTREHEKTSPPKPAPAPAPAPKAASAPAPGHKTDSVPEPKYKLHKVKKGESLARIGAENGVRYQAIAKANGITSPYIIRPDQILKIPDVKGTLAAQEKPHPSPAAHKPVAKPEPKPPAKVSGGITTATLGQVLREGKSRVDTVYLRNAQARPQTDLMHASRAPWMVVAQEEFEKGVKRRPGRDNNDPRIVGYFEATSLKGAAAKVDETPYCAAFANWCLGRAGFKGTGSALALSFKNWGRPTRDNRPALGAVAVIRFRNGSPHVTFVAGISRDGKWISTLGGNQGNAHEVSHSRCAEDLVIAYRYPANYPDYDDDYVLHDVPTDHAPMTAASTR